MSPGSEKRGRTLLLLSLVLTAVIAAGLPRLVFRPGLPPPSFDNRQVVLPSQNAAPVGMGLGSFSLVILLLVLAVPLVVLLVRALRGVPWKTLLARAWSLAWKLGLVAGALILVVRLLPRSEGSEPAAPLPAPKPLVTAPLGPVPRIVIWIAAIALGAAVVAVSLLHAAVEPVPRLVAVRPVRAHSGMSSRPPALMTSVKPAAFIRRMACPLRAPEAQYSTTGVSFESSISFAGRIASGMFTAPG